MTREKNAQVSRALAEYMDDRKITRTAVAQHIARGNSYVSDRLTGRLPLALDIMAGVAELSGVSMEALMVELVTRMRPTR